MIINCTSIKEISFKEYEFFKIRVSKERRKRAERFQFAHDAYRCVFTEALLKYSLFETFGKAVQIDLVYNEYGKPRMRNIENFFNISHSGDWVVVAYGKKEVGVDIEKIRFKEMPIIDCILKKEEKEYIYSATDEECKKRFVQIWGIKESYIKYLGTGLSTRMNTFSVNIPTKSFVDDSRVLTNSIYIKSILFEKEYYLSVCSEEDEVTIRQVKQEDILKIMSGEVDV